MTKKLFLHGVPDTPALWDGVLAELNLPDHQVLTPAMPGFGCPLPAGFDSHMDSYANWFIGEVEKAHATSGPVDLVGHDWGAVIVIRAASLRPDLVRSWAIANAAIVGSYSWHSMARQWQTPLLGEVIMMGMSGPFLRKGLIDGGMPPDVADKEVPHVNRVMKRAILKLYRSAKTVFQDWLPEVDNMPKRGLVFWGADDAFVTRDVGEAFAANTGADLVMLEGIGHWSVAQRPVDLAAALTTLWAD